MDVPCSRHPIDHAAQVLVLDWRSQFRGKVVVNRNQIQLFGGGHENILPSLIRPINRRGTSARQQATVPYRSPANSCSTCQFSSRSCLAQSSVSDGLPSLSKCLAKRPSLRAKSMNVTSSFVFGFLNQSSFTAGLPCSDSRDLIVSPLRGS